MAFLTGFEKQAGIATEAVKGVGKAVGAPIGFLRTRAKKTRQAIKGLATGFGKGFSETAASPRINPVTGQAKPALGSAIGAAKIRKAKAAEEAALKARESGHAVDLKPVLTGHKEEAVRAGAERVMARAKKQKVGPSFAQRHPYATAGGAFLAGKYMFEPKKPEEERPAVLYPQQ